MRTNIELAFKEEVHQIVGCAMEVLNELGHGFHEKIYDNALVVEFGLRQIRVEQQLQFPVQYNTSKSEYIFLI